MAFTPKYKGAGRPPSKPPPAMAKTPAAASGVEEVLYASKTPSAVTGFRPWLRVKTMGSHFGVGEFTTHFRTHFSGDWDVHWGWETRYPGEHQYRWQMDVHPPQNRAIGYAPWPCPFCGTSTSGDRSFEWQPAN